MKNILLFLMLWCCYGAYAQKTPFEEWTTTSGTQYFFQKNVTVTDGSGYVYVGGATLGANGDYNMIVSKYNGDGDHIWTKSYDGAGGGDDAVFSIAVDQNGNVFIAGSAYTGVDNKNDFALIKYSSIGAQQWVRTYNGSGSGDDGIISLLIEEGTGIFVTGTGYTDNGNHDFITIMYDEAGNEEWVSHYDYNEMDDAAHKLATDGEGVLYVTGAGQTSATAWHYVVVEYDMETGGLIDSYADNSSGAGLDKIWDITTDVDGNLYVTGGKYNVATGYDYITQKFDTGLVLVWTATYNGEDSLNDMGTAVKVDPGSGDVYVTGYSTSATEDKNYLTVKYNSSGIQQWEASYNGKANGADSAAAMVIDDQGNIIVTGMSHNGSTYDYLTVKYNSFGDQIWKIDYNGIANGDDRATNIALDNNGDIIVSGTGGEDGGTFTYRTIKYVEKDLYDVPDSVGTDRSWSYLANNGQLFDLDTAMVPEVKFYSIYGRFNTFLTDTSISLVTVKADTAYEGTDTLHRIDMTFKDPYMPRLRPLTKMDRHSSFFYGFLPHGRGRVPEYGRLLATDVWEDIDIEYRSREGGGFSFYIRINPGPAESGPSSVAFNIAGHDSVSTNGSGSLILYNSVAPVVLSAC